MNRDLELRTVHMRSLAIVLPMEPDRGNRLKDL